MAADYQVGFKRPPKASQFKKGESGNPHGRPKGTRNLKTDLAEELARRVRVTVDGRRRKISVQQAFVMSLSGRAIKGDARAATLLVNLIRQLDPEQSAKQTGDMTTQGYKLLDEYVNRRIAEIKKDAENNDGGKT
jgi:hypothetical protein